jgi:membrane protein implicated in regulation of membrane protease activity
MALLFVPEETIGRWLKTFARYLLFQIPGWLLLTLILWLLVDHTAVPLWASVALFAAWVLKDLAVYPWVRRAYENDAKTGTERFIGAKAIAQERLDPEGYVKINGELWKARADPDDHPIAPQAVVKVQAARGMTLIVERVTAYDGNR